MACCSFVRMEYSNSWKQPSRKSIDMGRDGATSYFDKPEEKLQERDEWLQNQRERRIIDQKEMRGTGEIVSQK